MYLRSTKYFLCVHLRSNPNPNPKEALETDDAKNAQKDANRSVPNTCVYLRSTK